jgi:hypothetical protein
MQELWSIPGGSAVAVDQLLYNLTRRGIEWDLLPWLRSGGVPIMAYSPMERAKLIHNPKLADFARLHEMTPAQAGLAWLLANHDVIVIAKTARRERLKGNLGALDHRLTTVQLARPVPTTDRPVAAGDDLTCRMFVHRPYRPKLKFFLVGLLIALLALTGIVYVVSRLDIIKIWNNWIKLFGA